MQLPDDIIEHIKSFVYHDRNSFSKTSALIHQLKDDMEHFINHYLYIIVNSPNSDNHIEISFTKFYFMYKQFREFERYFIYNRLDERLIINRFILYT